MNDLSGRREKILELVIESFIKKPEPVGSKSILRHSGLSVSSATIRNEMSELENLGYITHPHTSAGRVPTDKGYRYYVDHLVSETAVDVTAIRRALNQLHSEVKNLNDFLEAVSKVVSTFTNQVGIIVFPGMDDLTFRYVHFIPLSARRVLVVWATISGVIKEQALLFPAPVSEEELRKISNFMNQEFAGLTFLKIQEVLRQKTEQLTAAYQKLYDQASAIIEEVMLDQQNQRISVTGLPRFFEYPEFQNSREVRPLIELIEDKTELVRLFNRHLVGEEKFLSIGRENTLEPLWNCTLFSQSYRLSDNLFGTLSVLGPKRVDYAHVLQTMSVISKVVSELLNDNSYGFSNRE